MTKVRKAKKQIPYGIYCYGLDKTGKHCSCKNHTEEGCSFLNSADGLFEDGVKECGIRETVPPGVIKRYIRLTNGSDEEYKIFKEQERR